MKIHRILFCVAAASLGVPALAAPVKHAAPAKPSSMLSPPNMDAVLAFMDKLFPPQPAPDPARLALARTSVQAIWPDGAYGKMMSGFMGGTIHRALELRESDLAGLGARKVKPAAGKDPSLHDQALAKDAYFDKRMAAMQGLVDEEAAKMSLIVDPRMRDGLARAMARRFDAQQLADINSFFATPSGRALASQYMALWFDPDTIRSLFGSMPEMMKMAPELMEKVKAVNDQFPGPPPFPGLAKP
jgi:hypothetical protein